MLILGRRHPLSQILLAPVTLKQGPLGEEPTDPQGAERKPLKRGWAVGRSECPHLLLGKTGCLLRWGRLMAKNLVP